MADKEGKQFLVLLSINPSTPQRLALLVPKLKEVLDRISVEAVEQLFRSLGADHFGYLIRSKMAAGVIHSIIETPQRGYLGSDNFDAPFLQGSDGLAVIELGSDFHCGRGFTRAATWLQRH